MEFMGTKRIKAVPMTRQIYNEYRGWTLPENENGADDGYLVEYLDGGKANDERHAGYISWSPAEVFDAHYQPVDAMSFGHAVECLKAGKRVARAGWNGKGMFVFLVKGSTFQVNRAPLSEIFEPGTEINYNAHIDIRTADGSIAVWAPSQVDMMANDWQEL